MNRTCNRWNNEAREYLDAYDCILDEMIRAMTGAKLTDSISRNFIVQMIPHHRAAIEMSENILNYTDDLALREIAEQIIKEQTKSIADMQSIQCSCGRWRNSCRELRSFEDRMKKIMRVMFERMKNACAGSCVSVDFMREMIPHHMGAVEMSQTALEYRICPGLQPILRAIITSQKRGIRQMECLLAHYGCGR